MEPSFELTSEQQQRIDRFQRQVKSIGFRFFLLKKLPMAWLAGLRVKDLSMERCETTIPFKWLNQNPFRSTYFAVLSMAGEFASGLPALMITRSHKVKLSLLVVDLKATFSKKATGKVTFICDEVPALAQTIQDAVESREGRTYEATSIGYNADGEEVARFMVTWSFKAKS